MSSRPANLSFFFEPSEETEDNEVTKLSASSFIRNFVDKKPLFNFWKGHLLWELAEQLSHKQSFILHYII